MKKTSITLLLLSLILILSCGPKTNEVEAGDPVESEANELLEKEAWKIHDEVMPKMGAVHKHKTRLKEKIQSAADLSPEAKKEAEQTIDELDHAYQSMMDWMHNFKPEQHNESEEATREYLENEIENIKKVKLEILQTLEKAETVLPE